MLKILGMQFPYKYKYAGMSTELLFEENDCFIFDVEAPICWWTDFSGERTKLKTQAGLQSGSGQIFVKHF